MKQLTEVQAWREIARRLEKRGLPNGLCYEVWAKLRVDGKIDYDTSERMLARIAAHGETVGHWDDMYIWEPGDATPRIVAALLLAEEVKAEEALR